MKISEINRSHRKAERGFSMVGVLVTISIAAFTMLALSSTTNVLFRTNKSVELKGDLESIRQVVRRDMDCKKTLPATPASCSTAGFFALKSGAGKILIQANGENGVKFGEWHIRASCTTTKFNIEASRQTPQGAFAKDPLTKQELSWAPLFKADVPLCQNFFDGSGAVELVDLKSFSIGGGSSVTLPTAPATAPIGSSVRVTAKGEKWLLTTSGRIGALGGNRQTHVAIEVRDTKTNAIIFGNDTLLYIAGNTPDQTITVGTSKEAVVAVAPGTEYEISYKLRSTGCSSTCSSSSDQVGIDMVLKDYRGI